MIQRWEKDYLKVLNDLRLKASAGEWRGNRTGVRTAGGFGLQLDVPLWAGELPAPVTKRVHLKSVIAELLWFLKGETNIAYLKEHGCSIWDEWADESGELGPVYGAQWRYWRNSSGLVNDQIACLLEDLSTRPDSRRLIVTAWNPEFLPDQSISPQENVRQGNQALAPCHLLFQCYVEPLSVIQRAGVAEAYGVPKDVAGELSRFPADQVARLLDQYQVPTRGLRLRVDQRSADWMLGVPFNIASYALLAHLLCAAVDDLTPVGLCMQFGDYHLYENHLEAADEQLRRFVGVETGNVNIPLHYPRVKLRTPFLRGLHALEPEDIEVFDYQSLGAIAAPVAV